MQNKFFKIILIIAVISATLISLTYFTRTIIDIGCAKTGTEGSGLKRRFAGVNCWFWEKTFHLQDEVNINWK